jgi:hypothetical protein
MRRIMSSVACPALPYFSSLSHKRHDFRKRLLNTKYVFWFSLPYLSESFCHSKKNSARYCHKCKKASYKVPVILITLFRQIFEKFSNTKFHENPSSGSRVPCGRSYGRGTDMTKLIVVCCNFANVPKKTLLHAFNKLIQSEDKQLRVFSFLHS